MLQTDSTINVATAGTTGTLSGTVTGAGGLTKSAPARSFWAMVRTAIKVTQLSMAER